MTKAWIDKLDDPRKVHEYRHRPDQCVEEVIPTQPWLASKRTYA
jgi:hypothetical protein